ncbi:hypothetical protein BC834DRAFT_880529 [Gloeopeniophorella convolvens]|nr:hypothetical protein BC834DRAFT_880529 [Gloeopeniophorella convolvens]
MFMLRRGKGSRSTPQQDLDTVFSCQALNEKGAPVVRLLRHSDISKAIRTMRIAFEPDPWFNYLYRPDDARGSWKQPILTALEDSALRLLLHKLVRKRQAFTVKQSRGNSFVLFLPAVDSSDPPPSTSPSPLDRLIRLIEKTEVLFQSPEQRRRAKEWVGKVDAAQTKVLPEDELNKYFLINGLAVHPIFQGSGYGSALVNAVCALADMRAAPTWLLSSNIANTGFYNSVGFQTEVDVVLGDNNPSWHSDPVIVPLMVRPSKRTRSAVDVSAERLLPFSAHV